MRPGRRRATIQGAVIPGGPMSLPFRERRQLRALARAAVRDDVDLAVAFALFNHARKDEEMPFTERLRARAVRRRLRAERMNRVEWADWPDDTYPIFGPDLPLPLDRGEGVDRLLV